MGLFKKKKLKAIQYRGETPLFLFPDEIKINPGLIENIDIPRDNQGRPLFLRVDKIKINSILSREYPISEHNYNLILKSINMKHYNQNEPLKIWAETGELFDGHTRREAAIAAGLSLLPVRYESYKNIVAVKKEIAHLQNSRRNLTPTQRFQKALTYLNDRGGASPRLEIEHPGPGKTREKLGRVLGIDPRYAQSYINIIKYASGEKLTMFLAGDITFTALEKQYGRPPKKEKIIKSGPGRKKRALTITQFQDKLLKIISEDRVRIDEKYHPWIDMLKSMINQGRQ